MRVMTGTLTLVFGVKTRGTSSSLRVELVGLQFLDFLLEGQMLLFMIICSLSPQVDPIS